MVAFGLFFLLAVGIVAGFALAAGDEPAVLNLLGVDVDTTDRWVFATGALCAVCALVALRVIAIGWRRARRRRRELRELRSSVEQTAAPFPDAGGDRHRRDGRSSGSGDDWDGEYFESTPHD